MTTTPTPPPQPTLDPNTLALVERISAALGRTGPVLTPLQALLVDVRARLREMGQPAADACAPGGINLARAAQAAVPHVMCHAFCDLQLQVGDCDCGAQKALANLNAALAPVQPREVAPTDPPPAETADVNDTTHTPEQAIARWMDATDRIKCEDDGTVVDEEAAVEDVVEIVLAGSILVDCLHRLVGELAALLRDAKDVQQKWCDESNRAIRLEDELAAATARADEAEAWLGRIYKEWEELGFSKEGGARLWQYIAKGGEIFRGSKIQYGEVQTLCGCTRTLLTKPCPGPVLVVPLPARSDFTSMLAAHDTPAFDQREFEYRGVEYRGSHAVHIYRERASQARGGKGWR